MQMDIVLSLTLLSKENTTSVCQKLEFFLGQLGILFSYNNVKLMPNFCLEEFGTAKLLTNLDFGQLCPFSVFTTIVFTTINVSWLQLSGITWVISLGESLCLITTAPHTMITWALILVDAQRMLSSHVVASLFKTPS